MSNSKFYTKYENAGVFNFCEGFVTACKLKNLEEIEYLLNTNNLINPKLLVMYCLSIDYLEGMKFFNESTIKNTDFNSMFESVLQHNSSISETLINYFIFEQKIERSSKIDQILLEYPNKDVEKAFAQRELNQSLNNELVGNDKEVKKAKI